MLLSSSCNLTTVREQSCDSVSLHQVDGVAGSKSPTEPSAAVAAEVVFLLLLRVFCMIGAILLDKFDAEHS